MGGYYPDTRLFERRNRFRPALRHEGRGEGRIAAMGGKARRYGADDADGGDDGSRQANTTAWNDQASDRAWHQGRRYEQQENDQQHDRAARQAGSRHGGVRNDRGHDRTARLAGSGDGKRVEPGKLIYTM